MTIHCVLHDPGDSVAVVVVEGVTAGMTLTGLILDEDRTLTLPCVQDIPLGHKRHGGEVRRGHRQGGGAYRQRPACPRPQHQDQTLVSNFVLGRDASLLASLRCSRMFIYVALLAILAPRLTPEYSSLKS